MDRFTIEVSFTDVESLSLTCNFSDLADDFFAGNIDWVHREGERRYRFDLFGDNSFELVSRESFELVSREASSRRET